jgi:putative transcriptional regulator
MSVRHKGGSMSRSMGSYPGRFRIVNRLHVFRAERRMTQEQLAGEIGITRATVIAIERGDYNPSLELAFRLARFFETDINSIFSVEEEEKR